MSKVISFLDIEEYTKQKLNTNTSDELIIPDTLGIGTFKHINISNGIGLTQIDIKVKKDFIIKNKFEKKMFSFTSFLQGDMLYHNYDFDISKKFETNQLNISALNCENGTSFYKKGSHVKAINIFTSSDFLKQNILEKNSDSKINTILYKLETKPYFDFINQSPCSYDTICKLHNISSLNSHNKLQKLFIQSQTYELLYDWLSSIQNIQQSSINQQEKAYLAKVQEYIILNLDKEISLKILAKLAATNETKLQQNFKLYFKTTVFKYILECRMIKAKNLLKKGKHSIFEISSFVGYKYQSNFSIAFFKKYGISPKNIIKSAY
ncbi:AraC family transcriptional regulator [Sulfurimonas sp.]|uniref:helix-turn-helix domain-containing protein n=1 Tax=Sulfurimonas sp. TaxID=2022749 RepID=UPI002B497BD7|nr:AraC family transcriptional regulator [Sulfurimonas sp.]